MKRGIIAFALSRLLLAACGTGQEDAPDEHTPEVVPQAAVDMAEEYAENLAGDWSERGESEGWGVSGWDRGSCTVLHAGSIDGLVFYTFSPTLTLDDPDMKADTGSYTREGDAVSGFAELYLLFHDGEFSARVYGSYTDDYAEFGGDWDKAADYLYLMSRKFHTPQVPDLDSVGVSCDVSGIHDDVVDTLKNYAASGAYSLSMYRAWSPSEVELTEAEPVSTVDVEGQELSFYRVAYRFKADYPQYVGEELTAADDGWFYSDGDWYILFRRGEEGYETLVGLNELMLSDYDDGSGNLYAAAARGVLEAQERSERYLDVSFTAPDGLQMFKMPSVYGKYGDYGSWCSSQAAWNIVESSVYTQSAVVAPIDAQKVTDENGEFVTGDNIAFGNHHWYEDAEPLEGLKYPAIICRLKTDLLTAGEISEYWQYGFDVDALDVQSDYWTVYLAPPESEVCYQLSLASNLYTREDAVAFAESFSLN